MGFNSWLKTPVLYFFNYSSFECIFTEEGYDSGVSPEPLANVTAVPLVSEILQVWIPSIDCNALSACPAVNIQYPVLIKHAFCVSFYKVSETAFSLTAGYFLAYWWSDKRITVKEGGKRGQSCSQLLSKVTNQAKPFLISGYSKSFGHR